MTDPTIADDTGVLYYDTLQVRADGLVQWRVGSTDADHLHALATMARELVALRHHVNQNESYLSFLRTDIQELQNMVPEIRWLQVKLEDLREKLNAEPSLTFSF